MRILKVLTALLGTALLAGGAMTAATLPAGAEGSTSALVMNMAEVDLAGPAVSEIKVSLKNTSNAPMTDISVSLTGPINWTLYPERQSLDAPLAAGASATVTAEIFVPNNPAGSATRKFTATASYAGGDGAKTSFVERNQFTGPVPASLAELFNNVGTTTVDTTAQGNYDGEKNSFSRERLAEKGVVPGAAIEAAGTTFTWPGAAPGEPDNVSAAGQTFKFTGQGSQLAFLGAGVATGATGEAVVHYTDGSSSRGSFGFPNWGFQEATAHGATLQVSTKGRNTPAGYANAEYDYRLFTNTIAVEQDKTVDMVTLPNNGNIHIFAVALVPADDVPPTAAPATTAPATTTPATSAPATSAPAATTPITGPAADAGAGAGQPPAGAAPVLAAPDSITPAGQAVAAGNGQAGSPMGAAAGDLARTGSATAPLFGAAGLLMAGGMALLVLRRRREARHS